VELADRESTFSQEQSLLVALVQLVLEQMALAVVELELQEMEWLLQGQLVEMAV